MKKGGIIIIECKPGTLRTSKGVASGKMLYSRLRFISKKVGLKMETNDYAERYFYYGCLIASGSFTTSDGELKDYKKLHVFCGKSYSKKNATCATSEVLKLSPGFAEIFNFAKVGAEFVPVFGKAKIVDGKLVQSITDIKFLK